MFIELQVSAQPFAERLRSPFLLQPICVAGVFQSTFVVNHVEVLPTTSLIRVPWQFGKAIMTPEGGKIISPYSKVYIVQPVRLHLVTISQLEAANTTPSQPSLSGDLTLRFELLVGVTQAGGARSRILYDSVDLEGFDALSASERAAIEDAVNDYMNQVGPPPAADFPLNGLEDVLDSAVVVSNAGVAIDDEATFVAIRLEINGPNSASFETWSAFYQSNVLNRLYGNDWAVLIDQELLTEALKWRTWKELQKAEADDKFLPFGMPNATWHANPARVRVEFSGAIPDACPLIIGGFYLGMIDVNVDVEVDYTFTVLANNTLQIHVKFNWDVNDAEIFACALGSSHFWPIAYLAMLMEQEPGKPELDYKLVGGLLITHVGLFNFIVGYVSNADLPVPPPGECHEVAVTASNMEFECNYPNIDFGEGLVMIEKRGTPDGLVLLGTMSTPDDIAHPPVLHIEPESPEFNWTFAGKCSDTPVLQASLSLYLSNLNTQGSNPNTPLTVCGLLHREDPLGQYWPWLTLEWSNGSETGVVAVNVPHSEVKPEFWDPPNPYPFKLLINTNGGARLITVPPFSKLTEHDISVMHALLAAEKLVVCKNWSIITWAKNYHPEWVIDPPPEHGVIHHVWHVSAVNTIPGAVVRIRDRSGALLATARAGADRFAHATVVVEASAAEEHDVNISVEPPVGAQSAVAARQPERTASQPGRLAIRQTLITQESVIQLSGPVRYLSGGLLQGKPSLFCVTDRGLRVFDVEHPKQPRLSWMRTERGIAGALGWDDGFITWGEHGATYHALPDVLAGAVAKPVFNSPVIAAEAHRGMLYLLAPNALLALNRQFEVEASIPVEPATAMARVGDSFLVADRDGIMRVDAAEPRAPRDVGQISIPGVARLRDPGVLGSVRDALYVESYDRQGRVVGLNGGGPVSAVVTYETLPWIMHAVRVRTTLASVTNDQTSIAVFHLAGQRELIERDILAAEPV